MTKAEARSLLLHRAIAAKLLAEPELLLRARSRVEEWGRTQLVHAYYADAWRALLANTTVEIARLLVADDEQSHTLRQVSPFAGALSPQDRWRLLKTQTTASS